LGKGRLNLVSALIVATFMIPGCAKKEDAPKAEEKKSAEPPSHVQRGTNGVAVITLDAATQKVMGLQVVPLTATNLSPEVTGYGRVLDSALLSAAVADLVSAAATAEASQKDLARLKTLAEQNNASVRARETAEAAAQRDAAQAALARARFLATAGKAISERNDLPAFARMLASGDSALVRIELPAGVVLQGDPTGARLVPLAGESQPIAAKFIGAPPSVDPQTQGTGFLFLVESNRSRLVPGAAVTGFLQLPGDARSGVTVPRNAVVRFNGATWVYRQTGADAFERTEIALERPLANGWFVREGLKPQDNVVTVGAQQLLSEELKGQIGGD
jgi:multidrug efflux pump subunit AcrA (membrane-fusion protein)